MGKRICFYDMFPYHVYQQQVVFQQFLLLHFVHMMKYKRMDLIYEHQPLHLHHVNVRKFYRNYA